MQINTIKNRMAVIRWWAHKVSKQNVVARSNEHYGIPDRRFIITESKARSVTQLQINKVRDEHVRMSLELTGWQCPAVCGPDRKSLTVEQREVDREARLTVSQELGHEREAVVSAYLGR
jgi:hypothetical protein